MKIKLYLALIVTLLLSTSLFAQTQATADRNPVIFIPGIMGSKLVDKKTNKTVWVRLREAKEEQIGLPLSPNLSMAKDSSVATEIIEAVKPVKFLPGYSVYEDLVKFLEKKEGYKRGNWDSPAKDGDKNTYYTFPYDWRRDNVESARLLIQRIEKLKAKLKNPNLKFNIIGHSMGGLVARYAAMYGTSDLREKPIPNWNGARHIANIFLVGTPNEGSMEALEVLTEGSSVSIPLARRFFPTNFGREIGFSFPSVYQLLPNVNSAKFFDENLQPMNINIYDVNTWKKYGWTLTSDEKFMQKLGKTKAAQAEKYFAVVLNRARLFHEALNAKTKTPDSLKFYLFGSDCKNTLDGAIIYFNSEKSRWITLMDGNSFKTSKGISIPEQNVKDTIYSKGDGTVSLSSLVGQSFSQKNSQELFENTPNSRLILCEGHTALTGNKTVLENFSNIVITKGSGKLWGN